MCIPYLFGTLNVNSLQQQQQQQQRSSSSGSGCTVVLKEAILVELVAFLIVVVEAVVHRSNGVRCSRNCSSSSSSSVYVKRKLEAVLKSPKRLTNHVINL
ncbi:hypothetical protein DPMN_012645 [Dreissena polymorpha]|uniref:Uncharacterized protein n=1 Tax=Dreissena polymorpha TaxID=45954 RepID=A0A9D4N5X6_DREPO|nr:hypothetical protein DPMN_012645 [Dreissena polymorpha]